MRLDQEDGDMEARNTVDLAKAENLSDPSSWFHPALSYAEPIDVVCDDDLTLNEKRSILAAWASDACAVEAAPALRRAPGSGRTVSIDDILEALRVLDREAYGNAIDVDWAQRQLRRQGIEAFRGQRKVQGAGG